MISDSSEADNAALIERYGTLLEVYVPILYDGDARPAGVFELYLPYQPVQASIRADTTRAVALLVLGLVVLWLGLFRVVATASRRLRLESSRNEHQARHDALTGLANRAHLDVALSRSDRAGQGSVALVLLDLDRFREVNDTLGHGCGDEVVLEMAHRLDPAGGSARPGGPARRRRVRRAAARRRRRPGRRCCTPRHCARRCARRSGSAASTSSSTPGPASRVHPLDADDGPALLRHADVAAEQAKRTHVGVCAYDGALDRHSTERLGLLADLARAHRRGRAGPALPAQVRPGPAGCSASRRWSAGSTRSAACCRRRTSSRSPSAPGWCTR